MFQFGDNDINSYNSLSMSYRGKLEKSAKKFSSSKIVKPNEFGLKKINNQLNENKKVFLEADHPIAKNDNPINENENKNNDNNKIVSNNNYNNLKENELNSKNYSSESLSKLPKITKFPMPTNSGDTSLYVNPANSISNSIEKTISFNGNSNLNYVKNKLIYNERNGNQTNKRKNSLKLSGTAKFETINSQQKVLIPEENSNNNKKSKIKNDKMKDYIILPDFIGDEPLTEMEFKPILQDNLTKPQNERQYEINLYLNSHKMLNNLIYLRYPITKEGIIPTQNIVNKRKLNKFKQK